MICPVDQDLPDRLHTKVNSLQVDSIHEVFVWLLRSKNGTEYAATGTEPMAQKEDAKYWRL